MSGSFRKINYSLRPAKHAERKMMGEIFRRLSAFDALEKYSYIGLGSVWFADFSLYHKMLGIGKMVSIEKSSGSRTRFEANRPFNIDMMFKRTSEALPEIDWGQRSVVWLDYDGEIEPSILSDIRTAARSCASGSIVAASVNVSKAKEVNQGEKLQDGLKDLERFTGTFGQDRVPEGTSEVDLFGRLFSQLSRSMIWREIEDAVASRNAQGDQTFAYRKIAEFTYKDDAPMATVVALVYDEAEQELVDNCRFEEVDFLRDGRTVKIEVPMLTVRELKSLETQLPLAADEELMLSNGIPPSDAASFRRLYRYFPNFAALET